MLSPFADHLEICHNIAIFQLYLSNQYHPCHCNDTGHHATSSLIERHTLLFTKRSCEVAIPSCNIPATHAWSGAYLGLLRNPKQELTGTTHIHCRYIQALFKSATGDISIINSYRELASNLACAWRSISDQSGQAPHPHCSLEAVSSLIDSLCMGPSFRVSIC